MDKSVAVGDAARPLEEVHIQRALGHRPLLDRYAVQLPLLVLGALAVQLGIAAFFYIRGELSSSAGPTIAATQICNVAAAMIFREIRRTPGTRKFAFIFPAFLLSYSVLGVIVLIGRLPYSIWLALAGAASGLAMLWMFNSVLQMSIRATLYVKASPTVEDLIRDVPNADFILLESAEELEQLGSRTVIIDLRENLEPEWERAIARAVLHGTPVYHVKQAYESLTGRVRFDCLSENSFGSLIPARSYFILKRIADFALSLLLSVVAAIPMIVIAVAIRTTSSGPAVFRQERVGYRGQSFEILKFRTMHLSAAEGSADDVDHLVTRHRDPRVTPLGRFLRKTRLDELPQLLNVLRGDMSLIGPRPEARSLSEWYNRTLDFYDYRHVVKPGITGWAQVKLGHVTGVEATYLKTQYDFYYIKNLSAWLDFLIVLKTIEIMIRGRGAN